MTQLYREQGILTPLRVGLLIDSEIVPAWIEEMLRRVMSIPGVNIVLIVKNATQPKPESTFLKILKEPNHLLYYCWRVADKFVFKVAHDAFRESNITQLLTGIPIIPVAPLKGKYTDRISENDLTRIKEHNVDVFLRLGFRILTGEILSVARYGVWSFHHGDNLINRGGPAGVWELLLQQPTTGSVLQRLSEDLDGGDVLYRSWSATDAYSIHRNLNNSYWKTLNFVPRKLRELQQLGGVEFMRRLERSKQEFQFYSRPLFKKPKTLATAKGMVKMGWKIGRRLVWRLCYQEQWTLAYAWGAADGMPTTAYRYKKLFPPKDRYWADPCVVEKDGRYAVFIEEIEYKDNRGYLSVIEFDSQGAPQLPPRPILKKPYHLSYPHVFWDHDTLYMVPESHENNTIDLYRCTHFPDRWEYLMTLMENVAAVDSTILRKDGKYWLFTNIREVKGASTCDELFLFYSETLLSREWIPHPLNPIVSDVRRARPAGPIFEYQGQYYRPAQDCSGAYGRAIVFNRIDQLSDDTYQETEVSRLDAGWDPQVMRTHTFSKAGQLALIDGLMSRKKI